MNDIPELLKITTNFWALCAVLVILGVIFHVLFVRILNFNKVAWKKADYAWLSIAALGLLSGAAEVRIWVASNRIELATERTRFALQNLRSELVTNPPTTLLCMKFQRSEYSPSNLEATQKQFDAACEWLKAAPAVLPPNNNSPFKPLSFDDTHFPASVVESDLVNVSNWIRHLFEEYEDRRTTLAELQKQTKRTSGEQVGFAVSPILLCIALALRFAKVGGEIRLEQST